MTFDLQLHIILPNENNNNKKNKEFKIFFLNKYKENIIITTT